MSKWSHKLKGVAPLLLLATASWKKPFYSYKWPKVPRFSDGNVLLFLQFWVKDYKNKPLTILEVIKETLGFILKIMKKIARWRHNQKISIKSMKTTISQLFLHFWSQHGYQKKQKTSRNSNLLVWSATFQPKLNKLWKTIKKVLIFVYFYGFSRVFQSRMKSSGPNPKIWVPWSISLLLTPMLPTGMEK